MQVMKALAASSIALAAFAALATGCDRRREQPVEPSDTAQSSAPATNEAQPTVARPSDQQTASGPAPDPCAGLMDEALQDCRSANIEASRKAAKSEDEQVTVP